MMFIFWVHVFVYTLMAHRSCGSLYAWSRVSHASFASGSWKSLQRFLRLSLHNWIKWILFPGQWKQACSKLYEPVPIDTPLQTLHSIDWECMNDLKFRSTAHNGKTNQHFTAIWRILLRLIIREVRQCWWITFHAEHPGAHFAGLSHEAGSQMLIRAGDRRPSGRLIVGSVFYLAWLRGTGPLTWPAEAQGNLCCQHGMAAPMDNKEAFSVGQQPPLLISNLCSEDRYTCVSVESDHDVDRAAVFICCYMAAVDQMISPAMAHWACTSQYGDNNKLLQHEILKASVQRVLSYRKA